MATVKIDNFHGIQPRVHPSLLTDGMAVTAHNCRLKSGKLVPIREPTVCDGVRVYRENGLPDDTYVSSIQIWHDTDESFALLMFPDVTWSAPGNVADDRFTRLIVSGVTGEQFRDSEGVMHENSPVLYVRVGDMREKRRIAIAKNALPAPLVRRDANDPLTEEKRYTRFFVTWVDAYGMESPPSNPSLLYDGTDAALEYDDGDPVALKISGTLPINLESIRVYKSVTGLEDGYAQFVKEFPKSSVVGNKEVVFAVPDEDVGETMPEIESVPADLVCILDVPGSFYCGFSPSKPKTVCFSDVNLLYSWPVAYRYDISNNIVSLAVTSNNVFALTDGWPYVLSGTSPESMTVSKIAGAAACVSPRGICVHNNNVYFVSHNGLMVIGNDADAGTTCKNLTQGIFTKEQWTAFNPSSCIMGVYEDALHLLFTLPNKRKKQLIIDLVEGANAVTTHDVNMTCMVVDNKGGRMLFLKEED